MSNMSDFNATSMGQMQESVADPDLRGGWGGGGGGGRHPDPDISGVGGLEKMFFGLLGLSLVSK